MATMNQKNIALSPAVSDLGLGDRLRQQMSDEDEERKKKLLALSRQTFGNDAASMLLGNG